MNAGFRTLHVRDHLLRLEFPVSVFFPSAAAEDVGKLGPYDMSLA